jgi:hypothetical protein
LVRHATAVKGIILLGNLTIVVILAWAIRHSQRNPATEGPG